MDDQQMPLGADSPQAPPEVSPDLPPLDDTQQASDHLAESRGAAPGTNEAAASAYSFTAWSQEQPAPAEDSSHTTQPALQDALRRARQTVKLEVLDPVARVPQRARDQFQQDVADLRHLASTLHNEGLDPLWRRAHALNARLDAWEARLRAGLAARQEARRARHDAGRADRGAAGESAPPAETWQELSVRENVSRRLLPPLPEWRLDVPRAQSSEPKLPELTIIEERPGEPVAPGLQALEPYAQDGGVVGAPEWSASDFDPEFGVPAWPSLPARHARRTTTVVASPNVTRRLRDPRKRMLLVSSLVVVLSMAISLVIPGLAAASAMNDYNSLKALGEQAIHHLFAAKDDLSALTGSSASATATSLGACPTSGSTTSVATKTATKTAAPSATPAATGSASKGSASSSGGSDASASSSGGQLSAALDPAAFKAAESELQAAHTDFQTLRTRLTRPDWVIASAASVPTLDSQLRSIGALVDVGDDVSTLGIEVINTALPIVTRLHGATSLTGDTELLTQSDLTAIEKTAADAQDSLADVQAKLALVNLNDLPLCASQRSEITQVESDLPQIRATLGQSSQLVGAAGWLIGVDAPRNFLVQTLDPSELRPSGGFTGNYGVLTVQDGKLGTFNLYNVNDIDYGLNTNGWIFGRRPPNQYSWWPFANWGLRDSNLSGDFPTTAKIVEQVYAAEGGGNVDGVIQISPQAIANVLLVTGPIYVPVFNDTVTAANLVAKIHFYEEDPAGIAIQQQLFPDDHTHSLRKRFTQEVVQLLQTKVKSLPVHEQLSVAKQLLNDLQAKNIQVYVNNQQIEQILTQLQASSAIDTTPGIDGYFLDQANVSVAKSTPYVQMSQNDSVTLDNSGGATHHLVISMYNDPTGPEYGYATYHDYLRLYVPPQAQLRRASGFDLGTPMCWAPSPSYPAEPASYASIPDCSAKPYSNSVLACPAGAYGPGPTGASFGAYLDANLPQPLDYTGGPTNTASDIAGRAMWGGFVVIPQFCTATLTFDYYVPGVAAPANAVPPTAAPYTMLLQRQGSTDYTVNVTVHPSPSMAANGMQTAHYSTQVNANTALTLGNPNPRSAADLLGLGPYGTLFGLSTG